MSEINKLFNSQLEVINTGLESFADDLKAQAVPVTHVNWRPPAGGNPKMANLLAKLEGSQDAIDAANSQAFERIQNSKPTLVGVGIAGELLKDMDKKTVLHSGPPITWDKMSGPLRGAVIGALIYEGLADTEQAAIALAESGEIKFEPCHHKNAVGPMAGVATASMPMFIVKNETYGNEAYCTFNEGLGKVLRYGAYGPEVIERLKWLESTLYPVMKATLEISGPIDLRALISQIVMMGDEGHNRNKAATSLFIREIAPHLVKTDFSNDIKSACLSFINGNDHFALNLTMPAAKCSLESAAGIDSCSLLYTMARNGTEFGIRVAGMPGRWFTAPAEVIEGLFFPGFSAEDANPDIGDSAITETYGIGAFAMAGAPAIVQFVGGTPADALNYSKTMFEITEGESNSYKIPALNFKGTATGIDIRKVIETGILPVINTGIAGKLAGIGQVGAGVVRPPLKCFEDALEAFVTETIK